jgi:excinuclease ABC subunit B
MYADHMTDSMKRAIDETDRRRAIQEAYNIEHGITPRSIVKQVRDLTDRVKAQISDEQMPATGEISAASLPKDELHRMIKELEAEMKAAAKSLEFEKAALLRDQVVELKQVLAEKDPAGMLIG